MSGSRHVFWEDRQAPGVLHVYKAGTTPGSPGRWERFYAALASLEGLGHAKIGVVNSRVTKKRVLRVTGWS